MNCKRFHIEINSTCNLRCALCFPASMKGYQHTNGIMPLEMVEKVLDKIKSENPQATILPYGNSEPFLYPYLPEVIQASNQRGLRFELSSNLNYAPRLEEVVKSQPAYILIGVSGWTQEMYQKSHRGGDIEKVRANMFKLAELKGQYGICVITNYHVYRDNRGSEMDEFKKFSDNLGFTWMPSPARAISIENLVQYLRHFEKLKNGSVNPIGISRDGKDWDKLLPGVSESYLASVPRLCFQPEQGKQLYAKYPIPDECPIGDSGVFIRYDGKVTLCAALADRRFDVGDYLDMSQEQMSAARKGHPFCKECLRHRINHYCTLTDYDQWNWR